MLIILRSPLALLKKKGDVKGASKNSPAVNEEILPLLEGGGKLEVLLIMHHNLHVILITTTGNRKVP